MWIPSPRSAFPIFGMRWQEVEFRLEKFHGKDSFDIRPEGRVRV